MCDVSEALIATMGAYYKVDGADLLGHHKSIRRHCVDARRAIIYVLSTMQPHLWGFQEISDMLNMSTTGVKENYQQACYAMRYSFPRSEKLKQAVSLGLNAVSDVISPSALSDMLEKAQSDAELEK